MKTKSINSIYSFAAIIMTMLLVFSCDSDSGSDGGDSNSSDLFKITTPQVVDVVAETEAKVAMRYVPSGSFLLARTGPTMTISKAFLMAETEITQELWQEVMGDSDNNPNPSHHQGSMRLPAEGSGDIQEKRPVEDVTWYDAIEFCNELSKKMGKEEVYTITNIVRVKAGDQYGDYWLKSILKATVTADFSKNGYRLPTEMEWIWAAMGADAENEGEVNTTGYRKAYAGGPKNGYSTGINNYSWYWQNPLTDGVTHEVGKLYPNELGLYDMSGNVWEWCWDLFGLHPKENTTDYKGDASNTNGFIVIRGAAIENYPETCSIEKSRSPFTDTNTSSKGRGTCIGFRIVRAAD